uniref:Candiduxin-2 n=1 Tax=Bungarus candidus TaxID=92438 RepID=3SO92_BUNCA|nr:RecName: Full=Candiduxin-2; Flags: Precursor [Bungarus candidus]AAL30058.1 candiduxin 2 [Bungarus candidus]
MKTLLLTLVVLTIACLDLGYTKTCFNDNLANPKTTELCRHSMYFCFKNSWIAGGVERIERGCSLTCPDIKYNGKYIYCCTRDNCNA